MRAIRTRLDARSQSSRMWRSVKDVFSEMLHIFPGAYVPGDKSCPQSVEQVQVGMAHRQRTW